MIRVARQSLRPILGVVLFAPVLAGVGVPVDEEEKACDLPATLQTARPASDCELLFGTDADRRRNAAHRASTLEEVEVREYTIDVTHSTSWAEPRPMDLQELTLVGTLVRRGCASLAIFELELDPARSQCPGGLYLVNVDDSIGAACPVLAIAENIVLVERDGELRYMSTQEANEPVWRMVWHPNWKFYGSFGASTPPPPARPQHPRR
jgi:hypothetical protein